VLKKKKGPKAPEPVAAPPVALTWREKAALKGKGPGGSVSAAATAAVVMDDAHFPQLGGAKARPAAAESAAASKNPWLALRSVRSRCWCGDVKTWPKRVSWERGRGALQRSVAHAHAARVAVLALVLRALRCCRWAARGCVGGLRWCAAVNHGPVCPAVLPCPRAAIGQDDDAEESTEAAAAEAPGAPAEDWSVVGVPDSEIAAGTGEALSDSEFRRKVDELVKVCFLRARVCGSYV
jgi:hypothetical protein